MTRADLEQAFQDARILGMPLLEYMKLGWTPPARDASKRWETASLEDRTAFAAAMLGPGYHPDAPERLITRGYWNLCTRGQLGLDHEQPVGRRPERQRRHMRPLRDHA